MADFNYGLMLQELARLQRWYMHDDGREVDTTHYAQVIESMGMCRKYSNIIRRINNAKQE